MLSGVPSRLRRAIFALPLSAAAFAGAARADGEFLQLELGTETLTTVAAVERGALTFGLVRAGYEEGREWSLATTYRVARPRILGATATIKAGLVAKLDDADDLTPTTRVTAESYRDGDWGSLFWLAQIDGPGRGYYLGVQGGFGRTPFGVAVDTQGSEDWHESSAVLTYRIAGTPVTLRLGQKLESGETFVGLSISRF